MPQILSVDEADLLLSSIDTSTHLGMRDRAIFELLYATGIRLSELVGLDVDGVDLDMGFVRVYGKGRKERIVPIGEYAADALRIYLAQARPRLCKPDETALFVNHRGERLSQRGVNTCLTNAYNSVRLPNRFRLTAYGTALLRTCLMREPICGWCRSC